MSCHVLLAATGSVATVKTPQIAVLLRERGYDVRVILSRAAEHFWELAPSYNADEWERFAALEPPVQIYRDSDEWNDYKSVKGDPVLHIELRKWAHVLCIAPLSANTLAKFAGGLCDNLVVRLIVTCNGEEATLPLVHLRRGVILNWALQTCVGRAWDMSRPVIGAPAMNTHMWNHPFTERHLRVFRDELGYRIVEPASGSLACGDTGKGLLPPPAVIVEAIENALASFE